MVATRPTHVALGIIIMLLCGCASTRHACVNGCTEVSTGKVSQLPGLSLGLVADSHIQTLLGSGDVELQAGREEDAVKDSSLRPVAFSYFSPSLLEHFLRTLAEERVDAVVYLGDGSNNGCDDEIGRLLDLLRRHSRLSRADLPPIYYVIGNHDYLGRGNTGLMDERIRLCNATASVTPFNTPLDKLDLIEKVHEFNRTMALAAGHQYDDNYSQDPGRVQAACLQEGEDGTEQHLRKGCFLAGQLLIDKNGDVSELMLADTSDYYGKKNHYDNLTKSLAGTEYYGLIGFMSADQIEWFSANQKPATNRIVASHYDQHGPFTRLFPEERRLVGRMCAAFLPTDKDPASRNYWFSAHTHRAAPAHEAVLLKDPGHGCGKTVVRTLNVGSTIDNRPQATAVTLSPDGGILLKTLTLDPEDPRCSAIIGKMQRQPEPGSPRYQAITIRERNIARGAGLFGIGKDYRVPEWIDDYEFLARRNLEQFVAYASGDKTLIEACIASYSSKLENAKQE